MRGSRTGRVPRWFLLVSLVLAGSFAWAPMVAAFSDPAVPIRIAVSSFVGEDADGAIAEALSERLAERSLERLITPRDFIARPDLEPLASDIRRWAYVTAVDAIVVGRVGPSEDGDSDDTVVETALRSGHSGAELWRREIRLGRSGDRRTSIDGLASMILAKLGYPTDSSGSGPPDAVPAGAPESRSERATAFSRTAEAGRRDGVAGAARDEAATPPDFRSDAPIAIEAEEAEIIDRDGGRKLVFQKNVRVRQADVTLRSDRLEASYRKGESEPRKLVAEGRVRVDQGGRRAECDHAIYLRASQTLSCKGNATLVQGCDIVRGEAIEFDLEGNRVRVEGAASILIQPEVPEAEGSAQCVPDRSWM